MQPLAVSRAAFENRSSDVHELERWSSLAAAAAVMTYGVTRRTIPGVCLAIAATPLVYRGLVGRWPFWRGDHDTRTALGGGRGIHVREAVRLEKPVHEVYGLWRQLENLPHVFTHLEQVTDLGGGRSHWIARGPAGLGVEWDAEIINDVENKVIGWRSLPDADVVTAGSVNFLPTKSGGTQVSVHLQYAPPAGRAGAFFATVFGGEPSQTIRQDLRRLKQVLESGEIPRTSTGEPRL